ncbi:dimethylarginine dimethylaminohydrolase family protein [Erythrobacter colymbi]|uniref:dimethylarginine dimethylaminohydrolase family protein n=1 Tax=Erythrobacter colymbi TaxID=1161202 RepID=UPI000A3BC6D9|nr:hypothetical protein [Erythrobacter colymbi]
MTRRITAYLRTPSPDMASACELTFMDRAPIDMELAVRQHQSYADALHHAGADVIMFPALEGHPDCAFIEDTLLCLPEIVIAMRLGVASREAEGGATVGELGLDRESASIEAPGTLEGGDILRVGKRLYVGLSSRSNRAGIDQLKALVGCFGYDVVAVPMTKALHLKTAVTCVAPGVIVGNRQWVDPSIFSPMQFVDIADTEPFAGNVLLVDRTAIMPIAHSRTAEIVANLVDAIVLVDVSEFAKAEAGVTCLSVVDQ